MDFTKIRNYLFLGLLLGVTIVFFWILAPFAYPIFWAAVVAGISYPLYQKLNNSLHHPNLSTTITLVIVTVVILIPLTILGVLLFREVINLYISINDSRSQIGSTVKSIADFVQHNRYLADLHIDQQTITQKLSEVSTDFVGFLYKNLIAFTQNSFTLLAEFILMLYTLFFFIRDGEKFLHKLMYLLPLGDRYEAMLYSKFTSAARSTLKGTLVVGCVQGSLGGIIFAIAGIPGALIWGIIMAIASIIPATGSALIWFPAALTMLALGKIWQGIMILIVGGVVISTIDNLLRPMLVGKDLEMHPVIILFSTLGGVALFGISGFVIGPIIAALFLAFWDLYQQYYHNELSNN